MAVPLRLRNMPEHIRAQYGFPYSQVDAAVDCQRLQHIDNSQEVCNDQQMLQFPKTKVALWDHTVTGPSVYLHFAQYRKPRICVSEKVLRIGHRQCVSCGQTLESSLIGTVTVDDDGEGLAFSIDRLDCRPGTAQTLKNMAPGDVLIPVQNLEKLSNAENIFLPHVSKGDNKKFNLVTVKMTLNESKKQSSSAEDFSKALKLLKQRCESKDPVDVSNFVLCKGRCNFYSQGDQSIVHMNFDMVTLNTVIKASPVAPIPIVPSALSKNLAGPRSLSHIQGVPKTGYLSMDHTRKLLLVLELEPKVLNLPVLGIWVSGVAMVHHPFVWACCIRYLHNKIIQDRVCSPPEEFLVVLYNPLHSRPEFYQCNTTTGNARLDFDLYESYEASNLITSPACVQTGIVECQLDLIKTGPQRETFDAALSLVDQKFNEASQEKAEVISGVEDILPRSTPAPHQAKMYSAQPLVPEVSMYFSDVPPSVPPDIPPPAARPSIPTQSIAANPSSGASVPRHVAFCPTPTAPIPQHFGAPDFPHVSTATKVPSYPSPGNNIFRGSRPTVVESVQHNQSQNRSPQASFKPHVPSCENSNEHCKCNSEQGAASYGLSLPFQQPGFQNVLSQHQNVMLNKNCSSSGQPRGVAPQYSETPPHFSSALQGSVRHASPQMASSGSNPNTFHSPHSVPVTSHLPTSSSAVPLSVRQFNSAFTSNPHGTIIRQQNPEQLVSGYPQENLPGFLQQQKTQRLVSGYPQENLPGSVQQKTQPLISGYPQENVPVFAQQKMQPIFGGYSQENLPGFAQQQKTQMLVSGYPQENLPGFVQQQRTQPLISGYPQESLPGFVPQPSSCSSSRAHTDSTCSGKSSDDSGLSVTPDRSHPSPKTGSPATPDKSTASVPTVSGLDSVNWEQVPPEIFQLIMAQNAQLQQLQAQMQVLLSQQGQTENTPVPNKSCDVESGIEVSPSTRNTCDTAVNTTLFYASPGSPMRNLHTVSLGASPVKRSSPQSSMNQQPPDSQPSSSSQTPIEIRHKGALPLNSTQQDEGEQAEITPGDLTAVADDIALHNQTVESVQSEFILDMPSYQSSPTSQSQKGSGSLDGSYQTSPISASMCAANRDPSSQESGEAEESGPVDESYYQHLLGNIRDLLKRHSSESENMSDTTDSERKLPDCVPEDTSYPSTPSTPQHKISTNTYMSRLAHMQVGTGADTTLIPRINYLSMMMDSDSDTSVEINAMALKYLTDDQLTQLGKLRKTSQMNLPKQISKTALLRQVLMADTTASSDVSQFGMSSNNITMDTRRYMEKYGLLGSNGDETITDDTLQLKVNYSIASPVSSKSGSQQTPRRDPNRASFSPTSDRPGRSSDYSNHSNSSSGSKSPIKKDFVGYCQSPHYRSARSGVPRNLSPSQKTQAVETAGINQFQQYEEPWNRHLYPSVDSSEIRVFSSIEATDNILDIDKLRQMPKLL